MPGERGEKAMPGVGIVEGWLIVFGCVTAIWGSVACWCAVDEGCCAQQKLREIREIREKVVRNIANSDIVTTASGGML